MTKKGFAHYAGTKSLIHRRIYSNLGVTLGLATQACYFVKLRPKTELIQWAIRALASATSVLLGDENGSRYPIHSFIYSYLVGRDAVAADCSAKLPGVRNR